MRAVAISLALSLVAAFPLLARLGDSLAQTTARYGQPAAGTGQAGGQTSTRTFEVSGLEVTCGYVGGKVEMETYARGDRDFNSAEVEALLRTNGSKRLPWTLPSDGYVDGTYTRSDGVTANLTGNKLVIQTPKWTRALAKDQAATKAATAGKLHGAATDTTNPNYSVGVGTNAATYVESPPATNGATGQGSPATNAP